MKRVIVTGGTGFVGANLARRLLADGHEVHLLLRPGWQPWRIEGIRADVQLHELRIEDPDAVKGTVARIRPEWVFHLAAHGAYSWQTDVREMTQTNLLGTINLVTAGVQAGCAAFVHAGSSSEYGFKAHAPAETEALEPNSAYAVTKAAATMYCRFLAQSRVARVTTLRLYSVYGPYEDPRRLVPALIVQGLRGGWPALADPRTARDYVYIDDVVTAFLAAADHLRENAGAVYNVGTGRQVSLREAVEAVRGSLAVTAEPHWGSMPSRSWDTACWVADSRLIQRELGWTPRHSFEEGLRKAIEWFTANPDMLTFYEKAGSSRCIG
jgi:UDP-glucose 4-epimerase